MDAVYASGKWISVTYSSTDSGGIYASANGTNWSEIFSPPLPDGDTDATQFNSIAYQDGMWVAGGYETYFEVRIGDTTSRGVVYYSRDSVIWTRVLIPKSYEIGRLITAENLWIGLDYQNLYISTDGQTWTPRPLNTQSARNIAYGNGRYVVVGSNNLILTSTNLVDWQTISPLTNSTLDAVHYANGKWIAVGGGRYLLQSVDGIQWQLSQPLPFNGFNDVYYADNKWVAVGGFDRAAIATANADATEWRDESPAGAHGLYMVGFAQNQWLSLGNLGEIATSAAAGEWELHHPPTTDWLTDVAFGSGKWVASGGSYPRKAIVYSNNGSDWTNATLNGGSTVIAIGHHNGTWITVGSEGSILRSTNGMVFDPQPSPVNSALRGVQYADGQWVAVGIYSKILTSTDDGLSWSIVPSGTTLSFEKLARSDSAWVAAALTGVAVSTNAQAWTEYSLDPNAWLDCLAYGGGKWIGGGRMGQVQPALFYSDDATSWTAVPFQTKNSAGVNDILYTGEKWYLIYDYRDIYTSTNGLDWQLDGKLELPALAIGSSEKSLMAVGFNGNIFEGVADLLRIDFARGPGGLNLSWPATSSAQLWSGDKATGPFSASATIPTQANGMNSISIPTSFSAGFFILRQKAGGKVC
jgi:hypothetical protein